MIIGLSFGHFNNAYGAINNTNDNYESDILSEESIKDIFERNKVENVKPIIIMFGNSYEEELTLSIISQNIHDITVVNFDYDNSLKFISTTKVPIIWIGHGNTNGVNYQEENIGWNKITKIIMKSESDFHILLSCNSNDARLSSFESQKTVLTFDGELDSIFAGLISSRLFNNSIAIKEDLNNRINHLSTDPTLIIPLLQRDNSNPGSDFDFSPNSYGASYDLNPIVGTGGLYHEIIITTWFTADQAFINFYANKPWWAQYKYVHEIEIRRDAGTSVRVFDYHSGTVLSNSIADSSAHYDNPDCWPILNFCPDPADDPEFEWHVMNPEDLTVNQQYSMTFKYLTESGIGVGDYQYKLLITAETELAYIYDIYYFYMLEWDFLDYVNPSFVVKYTPYWIVTYTFSGNGMVFPQTSYTAINLNVYLDTEAYLTMKFTLKEFGYDPYPRTFYFYKGSTLISSQVFSISSYGGTKTITVSNIKFDIGDTSITIAIAWGSYSPNVYGLKTASFEGYFNYIHASDWTAGALGQFV